MAHHSIHQMWENFKKINPDAPERYAAWSFGNSKKMTDKTSTTCDSWYKNSYFI